MPVTHGECGSQRYRRRLCPSSAASSPSAARTSDGCPICRRSRTGPGGRTPCRRASGSPSCEAHDVHTGQPLHRGQLLTRVCRGRVTVASRRPGWEQHDLPGSCRRARRRCRSAHRASRRRQGSGTGPKDDRADHESATAIQRRMRFAPATSRPGPGERAPRSPGGRIESSPTAVPWISHGPRPPSTQPHPFCPWHRLGRR